jgi:hypothetical protein
MLAKRDDDYYISSKGKASATFIIQNDSIEPLAQTAYCSLMTTKKPKGLKKANRKEPWAYSKTIYPRDRPDGIKIWLYNFGIDLFGDVTCKEMHEWVAWIDEVCPKPPAPDSLKDGEG